MILAANTYVDVAGRRLVVVDLNLVCSPHFQFHSIPLSVHELTPITGTLLFGTTCFIIWEVPLGLKRRFLPPRRHRRTTNSHLHILGERSLFPQLSNLRLSLLSFSDSCIRSPMRQSIRKDSQRVWVLLLACVGGLLW